jgi:tight adherence protein B
MNTVVATVLFWLIPTLFMVCFAGLAFVLMRALSAGADAYSGEYSADTARQFEDIFLFVPPRRIAEIGWMCSAASFAIVFLLTGSLTEKRGFIVGLALGTLVAVAMLQMPRLLVRMLRRRRLRKFNLQLVDTLVSMSNALKAGFSIMQTFETVTRDGENPIAQEFGLFLQQTRVGVSFSDALSKMEQRVGSEDLTLVVLAIETARQTGGNLTEIFEQISATIRERMRIENRVRTLTAQGRLQGIVVGAMPLFIGAALTLIDPGLMLPFLHSLAGIVVVALVILLVACGGLVIRKIINIDI